MKYFYPREEIPEYDLPPAGGGGKAKVVAGKRIVFLDSVYDTGGPVNKDRRTGPVERVHPEEQMAYSIAGTQALALGGDRYDLKPGDVSVIHPYTEHEGNWVNAYRVLNCMDRINGHSSYPYGAWQPGAKTFFRRIEALMDKGMSLPCTDPWHGDGKDAPVYRWSDMKEYREAEYSAGMVKVIPGHRLLLIKGRYEADRGMGDGCPGSRPHSHPEEQITQLTAGKACFRVGDQWFSSEIGDVVLVPSGTDHEEKGVDGPFETITLKNRIYGHNIYDNTWTEGGLELLEEMNRLYKESEQFPSTDPWYQD